ncbi:hypothetical protein JNUCC64_18695 [Streptomyces sp. JNUCC 64]
MTAGSSEFAFLWDGSEEGWAVLRLDAESGTIYNVRTHMALVIEDDDEHERAIQSMKEHGLPVLDSLP